MAESREVRASRDEDPRVQQLVAQSVQRITALADVHTSLYGGQRFDRLQTVWGRFRASHAPSPAR